MIAQIQFVQLEENLNYFFNSNNSQARSRNLFHRNILQIITFRSTFADFTTINTKYELEMVLKLKIG